MRNLRYKTALAVVASAALLLLLTTCASCSLRLRGREAVGWSPEADLWLHYPMGGSNAAPVPAPQ